MPRPCGTLPNGGTAAWHGGIGQGIRASSGRSSERFETGSLYPALHQPRETRLVKAEVGHQWPTRGAFALLTVTGGRARRRDVPRSEYAIAGRSSSDAIGPRLMKRRRTRKSSKPCARRPPKNNDDLDEEIRGSSRDPHKEADRAAAEDADGSAAGGALKGVRNAPLHPRLDPRVWQQGLVDAAEALVTWHAISAARTTAGAQGASQINVVGHLRARDRSHPPGRISKAVRVGFRGRFCYLFCPVLFILAASKTATEGPPLIYVGQKRAGAPAGARGTFSVP